MAKIHDSNIEQEITVEHGGIEYKVTFVYSAEWVGDEWDVVFDPMENWTIEPEASEDLFDYIYDAAVDWTYDNKDKIDRHFEDKDYNDKINNYKFHQK